MAVAEEVAARLLKLLTGHDVEDEALDDVSTFWLHEGLTQLVVRARIGIEVVRAWEQEKEGGQPAASEGEAYIPRDHQALGYGMNQAWARKYRETHQEGKE